MYLTIGLIIGLLLGLTGAGGSVFAVPLLVLLVGLPVAEAMGLSLGAVAFAAICGSLMQWRKNTVIVAPTVILGLGGMFSAPAGRWLSTRMPEPVLLAGFCFMAVIIAAWMWFTAERGKVLRSYIEPQPDAPRFICRLNSSGQCILSPECVGSLMGFSLGIGFLSGLFGVGGGFMIVPTLLFLSCATMQQAVGSSLLVIAVVSSTGFVSHLLLSPQAHLAALLWLILGSSGGMILSALISGKIAGSLLQKVFAIALVWISIVVLMWRV